MSASLAPVLSCAVDSSAATSSTSVVDRINAQNLKAQQLARQSAQLAMVQQLPVINEDLATSAWLAPVTPMLPVPKPPPAAVMDSAGRTAATAAPQALNPPLPPPPAAAPRDDSRPEENLCWICKGPHFARECFHSVLSTTSPFPTPPPHPSTPPPPTTPADAPEEARGWHAPSSRLPTPPPPPSPAAAPEHSGWWEPEIDSTITCSCSMPALSHLIAWVTRRP